MSLVGEGIDDGAPRNELLLRVPDGNDEAPPFLYDHMPKAGGTFLIPLFRHSVGRENFDFRPEFSNVTWRDIEANFVVGSVRNPCDYYVSLWAYGSDHGGAMMHKIPKKDRYVYENTSANRDSREDIRRFHQWVRMLNKKGHPGIMSVRFARSYAVLRRDIKSMAPPMALDDEDLEAVRRALATPAFFKRVDCWVRMENVSEDAQDCLLRWGSKTGLPVNWTAFVHGVEDNYQLPSVHGECRSYFTPQLVKEVFEFEAPLFEQFNYTDCCA